MDLGQAVLSITASTGTFTSTVTQASNTLTKLGRTADEVAASWVKLGVVMTAVGVGISAALKKMVDAGAAFQHQMQAVKAVVDDLDDSLPGAAARFEALSSVVQKLGATSKFTAEEVGQAAEALGQAGFTTTQIIAGLPGVLNLAAAGAMQVGEAAQVASAAVRAFRLSASETTRVADVFAAVAAASNASVKSIGDAMQYASSTGSILGQSLEQVTTAIGVLANVGIQGSMAGAGLEGVFAQLIEKGENLNVVLMKYGLTFRDINPQVNSLREIIQKFTEANISAADVVDMFGSRAARTMLALQSQGVPAFDELRRSADFAAGAAERMAKIRMDSFTGDVEKLRGAWDSLMQDIFKLIQGPLRDLMKWIVGIVDSTSAWVKENAELVKTLAFVAAGIAGVTIAVGALTVAVIALNVATAAFMTTIAPILPLLIAVGVVLVGLYGFFKFLYEWSAGTLDAAEKSELATQRLKSQREAIEMLSRAMERASTEQRKFLNLMEKYGSLTEVQLKELEELESRGAGSTAAMQSNVDATQQLIDRALAARLAYSNASATELRAIDELIKKLREEKMARQFLVDQAESLERIRILGPSQIDEEIRILDNYKISLEDVIRRTQEWMVANAGNSAIMQRGTDLILGYNQELSETQRQLGALRAMTSPQGRLEARILSESGSLAEARARIAQLREEDRVGAAARVSLRTNAEELDKLYERSSRAHVEGLAREIQQLRDTNDAQQLLLRNREDEARQALVNIENDRRRAAEITNVEQRTRALQRANEEYGRMMGRLNNLTETRINLTRRLAEEEERLREAQARVRQEMVARIEIDNARREERFVDAQRLENQQREREFQQRLDREFQLDGVNNARIMAERERAERAFRRQQVLLMRDAFEKEDDLRMRESGQPSAVRVEEGIANQLIRQVHTLADMLALYRAIWMVREANERRALQAAEREVRFDQQTQALMERRTRLFNAPPEVDEQRRRQQEAQLQRLDNEIELRQRLGEVMHGITENRVRDANIVGAERGERRAGEIQRLLAGVSADVGVFVGNVRAKLNEVTVEFGLAPQRWVDAFLLAWNVHGPRLVQAVNATMAGVLAQLGAINVNGLLVGAGNPNLTQASLNRPAVMSTAGFARPVADSYNDNRSVDMVVHSNVDLDDVSRHIGLALASANMGAGSEV